MFLCQLDVMEADKPLYTNSIIAKIILALQTD